MPLRRGLVTAIKPGFKEPAAARLDQFTHLETTMEDSVAKVLDFELRFHCKRVHKLYFD